MPLQLFSLQDNQTKVIFQLPSQPKVRYAKEPLTEKVQYVGFLRVFPPEGEHASSTWCCCRSRETSHAAPETCIA